MSGQSILILVLVGILAGWLASRIVGGRGLVRYLIAGLLGSIVGAFVVSYFNIPVPIDIEWLRTLVVATGGAIIVILVARLVA
ncbi:MAG: GlsB/YeaQ/YmgE family stress response membrane protein [Cucumibacter sp.]